MVTFIGSCSFTVTFNVYVFLLPFSAVTVTSNVLSPGLTDFSPVPATVADESAKLALIFIFSVSGSNVTLYSKTTLSNVLSS